MLTVAKWATGIIAGGVSLGLVLANATHPDPKEAPAQWWNLTGAAPEIQSGVQFAEAWPEDLNVPDSYRPDLDYAAEVWSLEMPGYEVADISYESLPPVPDDLPRVTYGYTGPETQGPAETPAAEVADAPQVAPVQSAPHEARKSELALAGLY